MNAREETHKHIRNVQRFLHEVACLLVQRGEFHDKTKLESPEVEIFDEFTSKLKATTYGSPEYNEYLKQMGPALKHHYENNRHHPEHFDSGVNDMTLIDIMEMLCDWKAATLRHADGDIMQSIEKNKERFGLSSQLTQVLKNTVERLEWD